MEAGRVKDRMRGTPSVLKVVGLEEKWRKWRKCDRGLFPTSINHRVEAMLPCKRGSFHMS